MDPIQLHKVIEDVRQGIAKTGSGSSSRKDLRHWLHKFPDWYLDRVKILGKKYRPIRWLPLDVSRFELDKAKFLEWWDRESIDILRTAPDVAEPWSKENHPLGLDSNWHKPQFKGCDIYYIDPPNFESHRQIGWRMKLKNDSMFTPLIEQIMDTLPIYQLHAVYIWESVRDVYPHRDNTYYWDIPTEMRIMLFDDNDPITEKTLYVADVDHGDMNYISLPKDTNTFIWSNGSQLHGSDYHGKRKQLIAMNCIYDLNKYEKLIDKSIDKYKDQLNYVLEM